MGISTNVFGEVIIDNMLMECRSQNVPIIMQSCNTTSNFWGCPAGDRQFFSNFGGFQFYDIGIHTYIF